MRRRLMSRLLVGVMAVSVLAAGARADCNKKMVLRSTGMAADASGEADFRAAGARQRFKVSTEANVADGTTFVIYLNGLAAGTVTFLLHAGEAEFNNNNGGVMPNGIDVCSVTSVELRDSRNMPLFLGTF